MSHACGNGFLPILELLSQLEEVDPNLPDKDGNTPLIFASQAGEDAPLLLFLFRLLLLLLLLPILEWLQTHVQIVLHMLIT